MAKLLLSVFVAAVALAGHSALAFSPSLPLVHGSRVGLPLKTAAGWFSCQSRKLSRQLSVVSMQADESAEQQGISIPSLDKVTENIKEGTVGERGEIYVGLQFLLVFLVFIAPAFEETFETLGLLAGLAVCGAGIALGAVGVLGLGDSLSPWPKPTSSNELQTTGPYGLVRHPIYGGLLISCCGLSLLTASFPRLFFTILLFLVLDAKADVEEGWLSDVHSGYAEYKAKVPKLFPTNLSKVAQVAQDVVNFVQSQK